MKPTIINERYRLAELVGAGGMATVYRAEDLKLGRTVAMKFLREPYASDDAARERFSGEARAAARLDHPNVVRIYDVGEDEKGVPFIVMELVEGEDLKTVIRRDGPLTISYALSLMRQICLGVGEAHRAGIVHCDLKPQNIIVNAAGQVKVADFGIARALRHDIEDAEQERSDVVWGSPHYISPEQGRGMMPTPASDVYSMGVILYEMLTGVPPFHDPDPTALILKHVREEPLPLSNLNPRIPPRLDWMTRKALSKEPSVRFRTANQFGAAIDAYIREGDDSTIPRPLPADVSAVDLADETPLVASRPAPSSALSQAKPDDEPIDYEAPLRTEPVETVQEKPNDTLLWALIALTALAIVGLIPLWTVVYRSYFPPAEAAAPSATRPAATATLQPDVEWVTVPNLLGLSAADAKGLVESIGLQIALLGEELSTDARPGAIIKQTPESGSRAAVGSSVGVVVAVGRTLTLPDVVDLNLRDVEDGLEADGLLVSVDRQRSIKPVDTVLEQNPLAGAVVRVGQTVTLTVSGGTTLPIDLNVNLNDQVILESAVVQFYAYRSGDTVPVLLTWKCLQPFTKSYKVFIHVLPLDASRLITQRDIEPVNGMNPTTNWLPNDVIRDPHQIALPANVPAGVYQIRVGLYDPLGRLPVIDPGDAEVYDDTIFVTNIEVR